jgi:hypothetical protein
MSVKLHVIKSLGVTPVCLVVVIYGFILPIAVFIVGSVVNPGDKLAVHRPQRCPRVFYACFKFISELCT